MKFSSTTTSGNSNEMPNTSNIMSANPRYDETVMMASTSCAFTPRKNANPLLSVTYASTPPAANSGTAQATKASIQRRSVRRNAGTMNDQSWYSQIGLLT